MLPRQATTITGEKVSMSRSITQHFGESERARVERGTNIFLSSSTQAD